MGGCKNISEVKSKINVFKQLLADNPPQIWKDFFAEVQKKSYQINNRNEEFKIFTLPDNKELLRIIAGDDFLKKYIIKAEQWLILIRPEDVSKVKTHLKKRGYLIEFE